MAKNRYINTKFWTDPLVRKVGSQTKLLWLYLLTNNHSNIAGIYEIPKDVMQFESGIKDLDKSIKQLMEAGKIFYHDDWIVVINFVKHQNIRSSRIIAGIHKALEDVPTWVMDAIEIQDDPFFNIDCSGLFSEKNSVWIHYRNFNFNFNSNFNFNFNSNSDSEGSPAETPVAKVRKKQQEFDMNTLFDAFWSAYPRKDGKAQAKKAFLKVKPSVEILQQISASLAAYKQTKQWQDRQYVPHASTWLNQKRYEDNVEDIAPQINTDNDIVFE